MGYMLYAAAKIYLVEQARFLENTKPVVGLLLQSTRYYPSIASA